MSAATRRLLLALTILALLMINCVQVRAQESSEDTDGDTDEGPVYEPHAEDPENSEGEDGSKTHDSDERVHDDTCVEAHYRSTPDGRAQKAYFNVKPEMFAVTVEGVYFKSACNEEDDCLGVELFSYDGGYSLDEEGDLESAAAPMWRVLPNWIVYVELDRPMRIEVGEVVGFSLEFPEDTMRGIGYSHTEDIAEGAAVFSDRVVEFTAGVAVNTDEEDEDDDSEEDSEEDERLLLQDSDSDEDDEDDEDDDDDEDIGTGPVAFNVGLCYIPDGEVPGSGWLDLLLEEIGITKTVFYIALAVIGVAVGGGVYMQYQKKQKMKKQGFRAPPGQMSRHSQMSHMGSVAPMRSASMYR